mgnify:CR=1 FL=1
MSISQRLKYLFKLFIFEKLRIPPTPQYSFEVYEMHNNLLQIEMENPDRLWLIIFLITFGA